MPENRRRQASEGPMSGKWNKMPVNNNNQTKVNLILIAITLHGRWV